MARTHLPAPAPCRKALHRHGYRRSFAALALLALAALTSSGCLVRSRERINSARPASAYRTATLDELLAQLSQQESAIRTMNATVDVEPSVSSQLKGEVVHYRDVRSFLLIRKPGWLRMIGLYPVVRNTAFDLTSDGETFELYVPSKSRLVVGSNNRRKKSASALENLRPQHIMDALLWRGPDALNEKAALEVVTDADQSYYVVHILAAGENGRLELARRLWFERVAMTLARLQIFEPGGMLATDARYSDYEDFGGFRYPKNIVIDRPQDEYGLALAVTRMVFNEELTDEKFKMERPAGVDVVNLDTPEVSGNSPDAGSSPATAETSSRPGGASTPLGANAPASGSGN